MLPEKVIFATDPKLGTITGFNLLTTGSCMFSFLKRYKDGSKVVFAPLNPSSHQ